MRPAIAGVVLILLVGAALPIPARAAELRVMTTGLGSGTVTSPSGISCGSDCDETLPSGTAVTLTAAAGAGSTFAGWAGDCTGASATCSLTISTDRSVRAKFDLTTSIPQLSDFTPEAIRTYLNANPVVNDPARFVRALPAEFKQNWILMSRSESLQTGIAEFPRILLPSADARFVFTLGVSEHGSYPGSHPDAIEYMQWDAGQKNFRFHEIVLATIPAKGTVPQRTRGVSIDDEKCSRCHSTRNVLNRGTTPGTNGIPPGTVVTKNKPNWDSYDSWGGMAPFNRDRIYQGTVAAAAFRRILNPWTWRTNPSVGSVVEQLELQPGGVDPEDVITRTSGGPNDGHINFAFDASPPVLVEPAPVGSAPSITTNYSFNGQAGTGTPTMVVRHGDRLELQNSASPADIEGRGIELFDFLGGFDGNLNPQRIAHELVTHRFATGSVPIDVRPIALAIATPGCLSVNAGTNSVESTPPLTINLAFFDARNGMRINELVADTTSRARSLPLRKADIQKLNLDRTGDIYLNSGSPASGLIQQYGAATSFGTSTAMSRIRQEVFRRPIDAGYPDSTVMGGILVDRELSTNFTPVALYRYFLEPLGVSVDKWSMGVRGRSRTYTFADVFGVYEDEFARQLKDSLTTNPISGLASPFLCTDLIAAVNSTLSSLPAANAIPTYTDVQRIFNKSCIECHGGLDYPPYSNYGTSLDLSENEAPASGERRLARSLLAARSRITPGDPAGSYLYQRITATSEDCPYGLMPCGGPPLSQTDIETIRRWILGGAPGTEGDPHIKTIDGVNYDFQAAGEFVVLRDDLMEIQARQTAVETDRALGPNPHTGLTSCVSINTAVAVGIGSQRITYQPGLSGEPDPGGLELRVDGELRQLGAEGIPLAHGGRILQTTAPGGIRIEAPGGTQVIVTPGWWNHYQLWYLNIQARNAQATEGVMGAIAHGSWLPALPDGSSMGPRPKDLGQRYEDLYGKFADAWRVSNATTLFDYAPGASPDRFTVASWPAPPGSQSCALPRLPGVEPPPPLAPALPLDVAEQHCRDIVADDRRANCVQDVLVAGEPGFAETYLLTQDIESNARPTAPVLVAPEPFKTDVVLPITFTWNDASDPDGDDVTYRHCVWHGDETFNINECESVAAPTALPGGPVSRALLVLLLGFLVLALLIAKGLKAKPAVPVVVAMAILVAAFLVYRLGDGDAVSRTVAELDPDKTYSWKVVAEDGKGGTVHSETRRFQVQ